MTVKPVFNVFNSRPKAFNKPYYSVDGTDLMLVGTQNTGAHRNFRHVNPKTEITVNLGPRYELRVNDRQWVTLNKGDVLPIPAGTPHGPIRLGPRGVYRALNIEI